MTFPECDERYIYCGNTRPLPPPLVPGIPEVGFVSLRADNLGSKDIEYVRVLYARLTRDFEYFVKPEEVQALFVPEQFPKVENHLRIPSYYNHDI